MQAQILPAANLWNVTVNGNHPVRVDTQDLQAVSSGAASISFLDSNGDPVTVNPLPFDPTHNRFEVWALLMAELQDAFGHSGQEAFLTMVPIALLAALPSEASGATSLRLVEIQAMNSLALSPQRTTWQDLAGDLFPQNSQAPVNPAVTQPIDPAMARARIVRVSPSIQISQ